MSSWLLRTFETVVIDTPSSPAIRFIVVAAMAAPFTVKVARLYHRPWLGWRPKTRFDLDFFAGNPHTTVTSAGFGQIGSAKILRQAP
jgi:hypothetical protein